MFQKETVRTALAVLCGAFLLSIPLYFSLPLIGLADMSKSGAEKPLPESAPAFEAAACGNGRIEASEQCDDGNIVIYDGCTGCMVEAGYSCMGAPSICTAVLGSLCGNGRIEAPEQCDDGNIGDFDGCSRYCGVEEKFQCEGMPSRCMIATAVCGDGMVDIGEPCDDGGTAEGDGCSAACAVEEGYRCGGQPSGCVRLPEIPASSSAPALASVASSSLSPEEPREAGAVEAQHTTATASASSGPYRFRPRMRADVLEAQETSIVLPVLPPRSGCGDGVIVDEACDDGGVQSGDGCSASCGVEDGWTCNGSPSACRKVTSAIAP